MVRRVRLRVQVALTTSCRGRAPISTSRSERQFQFGARPLPAVTGRANEMRTLAGTCATLRGVTPPHPIPSACGDFAAAMPLACPRFPPRNLNGKEGVDGSSPSEGFT